MTDKKFQNEACKVNNIHNVSTVSNNDHNTSLSDGLCKQNESSKVNICIVVAISN